MATASGDAATAGRSSRGRTGLVAAALVLVGLSGFAVAQPLYDLLAGHVTFLIAHEAEPLDVVVVALAVWLAPAAVAFAVVACARVVSDDLAFSALALAFGLGVAVSVLPPLHRTLSLPGAALVAAALALGCAAGLAYWRVAAVRSFAQLLAVGAAGFAAWFLLVSPASELVVGGDRPALEAASAVGADTPVVLVVFDQFPLFTLLDAEQRIDRARYPSFAALADRADWFRNATTVAGETVLAVPAILTGRYPDRPRLPRYTEYPDNLFTRLGRDYRLNVTQTMTDLCPPDVCERADRGASRAERVDAILADAGFLYLHVLLPSDLREGLPDVGSTWRDFNNRVWAAPDATVDDPKASWGDPTSAFARFLAGLDDRRERVLHFLHVNVPHVPWKYLPSGAVYGPVGRHLYPYPMNGLADVGPDDGFALDRALQRHLLQVGFADRMLGELMGRLERAGILDAALVVVTADHGITFWPTRGLDPSDYRAASDVLNVPLFVKRPGQRVGRVDDANVETIDLVPTIADVLGLALPDVDGRSVYDADAPPRPGKRAYVDVGGSLTRIDYPATIPGRTLSVRRMHRVFGASDDPLGLFRIGLHVPWIGRPVAELPQRDAPGRHVVELEFADAFAHVDPDGPFVPARVTGEVRPTAGATAPHEVAIAINGTVWATARTFESVDGGAGFDAMVPPIAFRPGPNDVDVYAVDGAGERAALAALQRRARRSFTLVDADAGGPMLRASDGREIPIVAGALMGRVDSLGAMLGGWAREGDGERVPESIVVFANGRFYEERDLSRARKETVERAHLQDADGRTLKFDMVIPFEILRESERPELRVFAISGDVASELEYRDGFAYRPGGPG